MAAAYTRPASSDAAELNDVLKCNRADVFINRSKIPTFYKNVIINFQSVFRDNVDDDIKARGQSI